VTTPALPGDDDVRAAADELLTRHRAGGTYPSVSALAKGFGINRTSFYRHYAAITTPMLDSAAHQHDEGSKQRRPRRHDAAEPFAADLPCDMPSLTLNLPGSNGPPSYWLRADAGTAMTHCCKDAGPGLSP
jgi:hypothetical protein